MAKIEPPTATLMAGVLADNAIQPALEPARQAEISRVDGELQRVVEDCAVEPVRHDEIDAVCVAVRVGALGPFVNPREAVHTPLGGLAQRGRHGGRLQSIERCLQPVIIAGSRAAAGERTVFITGRRDPELAAAVKGSEQM